MKNNSETFAIEITVTPACNFRCEYCFESNKTKSILSINEDIIIKKVREIFNSKWVNKNFVYKNITFWGGEPTLNENFILKILNEFYNDDDISFYLYTNGSNVDFLLPFLQKSINKKVGLKDKFSIQFSYDGNPVHDLRRKTITGQNTSNIIKENMNKLFNLGINFTTKSTITYKDYKFLPEIWDDFYELNKKFKIRYGLTIDYHKVEFLKYKDEIEETILKIAKKEHNYFSENGRFLSNIFERNKAFCSCGKSMTIIDHDGYFYYCHGCIYSENIKPYAYITDNDIIEKIEKNYSLFEFNDRQPDDCSICIALSCLRCNVKKAEFSTKENFIDKWYDYTCQEQLCEYYKLVGRIGRALYNIINEVK